MSDVTVKKLEEARNAWSRTFGLIPFTYEEFMCKCSRCEADRAEGIYVLFFVLAEFGTFMRRLVALREDCGFPFPINSGWRCQNHPIEAARVEQGKPLGPHYWGAADIRASFERAYPLMATAMQRGMGVGAVQHGPIGNRFVHVDNQGMRVWTYNNG